MTANTNSTRRSFLKGGALLAAPLTVAAASTSRAEDGQTARLARLEAERAIRALHQAWLKGINAGKRDDAARLCVDPPRAALDETLRRITPDPDGEPERIEVAANGESAVGRYACIVDLAAPIAKDCTPARMAHAQGGGIHRRRERRVLTVDFVKKNGAWAIAKARFAPA